MVLAIVWLSILVQILNSFVILTSIGNSRYFLPGDLMQERFEILKTNLKNLYDTFAKQQEVLQSRVLCPKLKCFKASHACSALGFLQIFQIHYNLKNSMYQLI